MSDIPLPAELLDRVINLVRVDSERSFKNCCLVSKSWIPHVRRYLFEAVVFDSPEKLRLWTDAFPDPSSSPAYHVKKLTVKCPQAIDDTDKGFISTFRNVVDFTLYVRNTHAGVATCFHGFSTSVKILCVDADVLSASRIVNLACSFPRLENLSVFTSQQEGVDEFAGQPTSSPPFTGKLSIRTKAGMDALIPRLLSVQGGLHFRTVAVVWYKEGDSGLTTSLVESCRSALKHLKVDSAFEGTYALFPF